MKRRRHPAAKQRSLTRVLIVLIPLAAAATTVIVAVFAALFLWLSPTTAQEPAVPPETPDAGAGLETFAERCSNCHGPMGLGDGEMAPQLPQPPTAVGSQEYLRQAVPAEMFDVVTNGVLEAGMPPFGPANSSNPLDETSRWNTVAAIYSLGTSPNALEAGEEAYAASCSECHGADGVSDEFDLTTPSYWATRSNQQVFDAMAAGGDTIPEHEEIDLSDEELWAVVDYARTFSYDYADPLEAVTPTATVAPIEAATITGTVVNETTGERLGADVPVELNAFTASFEPSLTMTSTLDEDGRFSFNLTMVPADQVYVATVAYNGISFGSDFGEIDPDSPALELPVVVYEQTSDPAGVRVGQLHVILEFTAEQVQVSELYQFSHDAPTVFVGEAGDATQGTVQLTLPDGASTPSFSRTFGSMDSFFPAENVIPTGGDNGWADTVPLRPGQGTLSLLVRYTLPYESGTEIAHPVQYDVDNVNLVLTAAGVSLADAEDSKWTSQGEQAMGGGSFLNYTRGSVPAGEIVSFSLEGEPRPPANEGTGAAVAPNESTELLIGGGVLLLAIAVGVYLVRLWQGQATPEPVAAGTGPERVAPARPPAEESADRREELLHAIAQLDDAYEAGEVGEEEYERRRQALKEALLAIWEGNG